MDKPVSEGSAVLIGTIGQFRLTNKEGTLAPLRTRKARALVAVLALEGRHIGRERIADLLWSDRGTEQARSSLRQALFEIRHADSRLEQLIIDSPNGLSLNTTIAGSDLHALKLAADGHYWFKALQLLSASSPDLLEDLNGIDPIFDEWLRSARTAEPAKTLAHIVSSGERCLERHDPQLAADIASEVLRLDPSSESGARLAMRAAGSLGDRPTINRIYQQFEARLADQFDAAPSEETMRLLADLNYGPASTARTNSTMPIATVAPGLATQERHPNRAVAVAMLIAGVASAALLGTIQRQAADTAWSEPLVAAVPFEAVDRADEALAEGIWDDTRSTLSRSGVVQVLGRTTSETLADSQLSPTDYRDRLDVDFILDGSLRRDGNQVRVTVSLLRTEDGVAIWEHAFNGKLGDAFALQGAIATGIEGRIRGRLAQGGGAKATQIPTTPEVYELYVRSKNLLKSRTMANAAQAREWLEKAIQLDPNFAPALALSASSLYFSNVGMNAKPNWRKAAKARAARAIDLAPRLGEAHAIYALIDGLNRRSSEQHLMTATRLDPSDSQGWLWLGNARMARGDFRGGLTAHSRAVQIDPFLVPALANLTDELLRQGDKRSFDALVERLDRAGAGETLVPAMMAEEDYLAGRYAQGVQRLMPLTNRTDTPAYVKSQLSKGLAALGDLDSGAKWELPRSVIAVLKGESLPDLSQLNGELMLNGFTGAAIVRTAMKRGESAKVFQAYQRNFGSVGEYADALTKYGEPELSAPYIALILQSHDRPEDAKYLLDVAAGTLTGRWHSQFKAPDELAAMARIRSAQGRKAEALSLLAKAVSSHWTPDGVSVPTDLSRDPAFMIIDGPEFRRIRRAVLDHVNSERAKLNVAALPTA